MLADDNADMRDYVSRLLGASCDVRAVGDGEAALEAVRSEAPDLIITDVMMPRLDGFGLLRAIRERRGDTGAAGHSCSRRGPTRRRGIEGLEAGADDYLVKPFSANELVARVNANLKLARSATAKTALERRTEQFERPRSTRRRSASIWSIPAAERSINPIANRSSGSAKSSAAIFPK